MTPLIRLAAALFALSLPFPASAQHTFLRDDGVFSGLSFTDIPSSAVTMVNVTAPPYNAKCDGSTNDAAAFVSATSSGHTVYVPYTGNVCVIGTSGSWANGSYVVFDKSAAISVSNGVTLTIRGQVDHGNVGHIFQGSGAVTGLAWVRPEWFGAFGTGTAHNDYAAFQTAENSMEASNSSDGNPCLVMQARQYGIGSTVIITPTPNAKVCWEGAGSSGSTNTQLIGLASFTGSYVLLVTGSTNGASADWDIHGFAVYPQTVGSGPGSGIGVGFGTYYLQGAFHQSKFENIHVQDFPIDWNIANARLFTMYRVSGWEVNNATGTSIEFASSSSTSFTGDIDIISSQFTGVSGGLSAYLNCGTSGATIAGIKFIGTDLYIAPITISAGAGCVIQDIWFTSGYQYDGITSTGFTIGASGSGAVVKDIHIENGYMAGNPTGAYVNSYATTGGQQADLFINGNMIKYNNTTSAPAAVISTNGISAVQINNNIFTDIGTTSGGQVMYVHDSHGVQINHNVANNELTANSFKYFVTVDGTSDYFSVLGNMSNGIATNGTTQNANVSNGASGTHTYVSQNW